MNHESFKREQTLTPEEAMETAALSKLHDLQKSPEYALIPDHLQAMLGEAAVMAKNHDAAKAEKLFIAAENAIWCEKMRAAVNLSEEDVRLLGRSFDPYAFSSFSKKEMETFDTIRHMYFLGKKKGDKI